MKYDYHFVGAGFAAAEQLASQHNKKILLVEKRNHIGGNAYDEFDKYGVLVHKYGQHIYDMNDINSILLICLISKSINFTAIYLFFDLIFLASYREIPQIEIYLNDC